MTSKKDKLLERAQKFIAKGQLDRAIRDYEQIVGLDSGDIRHRQKLAELLVRVNRKEDAIAEYEAISRHYSNNHFYLKAIAVYKQIQKLDPANIKTTLTLASLNEKQGLIGNALAEYNLAVNFYLKAASLPEAIKVIEQMLAADPENLNTHLKCAETYFTAGLREKAYGEFTRLAHLLLKRGDDAAFSRVCERVHTLFPEKTDFADGLLTTHVGGGKVVDIIDSSSDDTEEALMPEAELNPVVPETPLPAEPPPVVPEAQLPAEPQEPPMVIEDPFRPAWEEEIDLSLLEEEGISIFQDDAGTGDTAPSESTEELPQQNRIEFSSLEIGGIRGTDFSETNRQPESEQEYTEVPFNGGEATLASVDLSGLDLEIEVSGINSEDKRPDLEQIEPVDGATDEKVRGKESVDIPPVKKKLKYDLEGQFNEFKKVLDDQLDKNDTETHYSLGIAYKEMCLFDDAINEFQTASQDPQRRIDCMTLEGVCYRDKVDYAKAEEIFNNTLAMQGLSKEEIVSLRYELAMLFEAVGRQEEALQLYRQVRDDNPGFRDATKKIALLLGGNDTPEQDEIELLELDLEGLD